jgi:hypothetical protein
MTPAAGRSALMGSELPDMRQPVPRPTTPASCRAIECAFTRHAWRNGRDVEADGGFVNAKAGHKVPSGSAEARTWAHVRQKDAKGQVYLPVDKRASARSLRSRPTRHTRIGEVKGIAGFPGLRRDGEVPVGDRIFRLPYLDPKGRMTIMQWSTASFGPDYRLAPLAARSESYTWKLPATSRGRWS